VAKENELIKVREYTNDRQFLRNG